MVVILFGVEATLKCYNLHIKEIFGNMFINELRIISKLTKTKV